MLVLATACKILHINLFFCLFPYLFRRRRRNKKRQCSNPNSLDTDAHLSQEISFYSVASQFQVDTMATTPSHRSDQTQVFDRSSQINNTSQKTCQRSHLKDTHDIESSTRCRKNQKENFRFENTESSPHPSTYDRPTRRSSINRENNSKSTNDVECSNSPRIYITSVKRRNRRRARSCNTQSSSRSNSREEIEYLNTSTCFDQNSQGSLISNSQTCDSAQSYKSFTTDDSIFFGCSESKNKISDLKTLKAVHIHPLMIGLLVDQVLIGKIILNLQMM